MDLKLGGIAAAVAFVLSFLIGLVSRSTMPLLIIWPLVFAAVFFVIIIVAKFLFGQFLPELLGDEDSGANSFPGAMVNIMEGDTNLSDDSLDIAQGPGGFSSPAVNAARPEDSDKSIGDISTLSEVVARNKAAYRETSAGIDQNMENGYTLVGGSDILSQSASPFEAVASGAAVDSSAPVKPVKQVKSGSSAWYSTSDDTLPDLDSMAGVFTNASAEEESETGSYSESSYKRKTSSKGQSLEGDFDPKDIAAGIRTVLKKDKEE